jgi:hypothetical protein
MRPIGEGVASDDDRQQGRGRRLLRSVSSFAHTITEAAMAHLLDPKRIDSQTKYLAALDELDALMAEEPDACAGTRIDELFALIEEYELRQPVRASPTS